MKEKAKREGALKIGVGFDDAIKRALRVKPPQEGWSAFDKSHKQRRKHKSKSR